MIPIADNLTNTAEDLALNWLNPAVTAPTRPTSPLKVALITTATPSTDTAAGSEVSGGSYTRQNVTFGAASGGSASNSADVTFTNMPAVTVAGVEIYDSAGTPVRLWYGPLTASKTTNSGDTFTIAAGSLTLQIS